MTLARLIARRLAEATTESAALDVVTQTSAGPERGERGGTNTTHTDTEGLAIVEVLSRGSARMSRFRRPIDRALQFRGAPRWPSIASDDIAMLESVAQLRGRRDAIRIERERHEQSVRGRRSTDWHRRRSYEPPRRSIRTPVQRADDDGHRSTPHRSRVTTLLRSRVAAPGSSI